MQILLAQVNVKFVQKTVYLAKLQLLAQNVMKAIIYNQLVYYYKLFFIKFKGTCNACDTSCRACWGETNF